MNGAPPPPGVDGVRLAYAKQSWTTAVHLELALSHLTSVDAFGPGHPHRTTVRAPGRPLIWVESGLPWLPDAADLLEPSTCAWLIDTHRGWRWRAELARAFTTVFVAQRAAVRQFGKVGVRATWLPLAAPAELSGPGGNLADRPFDVALVGQSPPGSNRARLLAALERRFKVAPTAGRLEPGDMMDVYRSARVVINPPLAKDLNMRAFEALAARALLVTGPMDAARDVLGDLPVVVESDDPATWERAIGAVLADPESQGRADRGFELVLAQHTYAHRAARLLEAVAARPAGPPDRQTVTRALAHGHARWGQVGQTWALSHDVRLGAEAAAWASATELKRRVPGIYRRLRPR